MTDTLFWFAVILFAVLMGVAMLGFLANVMESLYNFLANSKDDKRDEWR